MRGSPTLDSEVGSSLSLHALGAFAILNSEICDMRTKKSNRAISGAKKRAAAASKAVGARSPAAHIMAAPKGPRTVSHRRIAEAVDKVFRERTMANA
jgi:hypothetical protein